MWRREILLWIEGVDCFQMSPVTAGHPVSVKSEKYEGNDTFVGKPETPCSTLPSGFGDLHGKKFAKTSALSSLWSANNGRTLQFVLMCSALFWLVTSSNFSSHFCSFLRFVPVSSCTLLCVPYRPCLTFYVISPEEPFPGRQ